MKILYLGRETGTSGHRANALRRLGHEVQIISPESFIPKLPLMSHWHRIAGSIGVAPLIRKTIIASTVCSRPL